MKLASVKKWPGVFEWFQVRTGMHHIFPASRTDFHCVMNEKEKLFRLLCLKEVLLPSFSVIGGHEYRMHAGRDLLGLIFYNITRIGSLQAKR